MQSRNQQQIKGQNKINYKQKNLQYIEKLKEKNKKQQQQKQILQKKQLFKRQSLRKKILDQASKNRQNKLRELTDIGNHELSQKGKMQKSPKQSKKSVQNKMFLSAKQLTNFTQKSIQNNSLQKQQMKGVEQKQQTQKTETQNNESIASSLIPQYQKIQSSAKAFDMAQGTNLGLNNQKQNYQNKYIQFLQNLHQTNKSKKEIQEKKKKKQQQKYNKIKQDLGYDKIQGKLNTILQKKTPGQLLRTKSAQKINSTVNQGQINSEMTDMPKTIKNFQQKNDQYIEKIKKKRKDEQDKKNVELQKKQKLKQNLKEFVINTVKKNVLDGVYDDQIVDKKEKKKPKSTKKEIKDSENQDDEQPVDDESSSSQQQEGTKKKRRKLRSFPHCADYNEWKKKNRLQQGEKVYIVTGGYPDLQKALKSRGWLRNPDSSSLFFDLKFTLQGRQIDYGKLQDFQLCNHYQKNGAITTKIGLTKTLRNLMWVNDTSEDNFYPKCFDLNDEDDKIGFQSDFKLCKALSILKMYADSAATRKTDKSEANIIEDLKLRTEVALSVCKKNIQDVNEVIDKKKFTKTITDKEWEILSQDQLNQESLAKKKHQQWLKSIDCKFNAPPVVEKKTKKKVKKSVNKQNKEQQKNQKNQGYNDQQEQQEDQLLIRVKQILSQYQKKFAQYHLTGHNNIWILKPAGLSRGRGITTYNNLVQIQDHMKTKQSQWIAQKYIQNPLIIERRKFDIRQWVMVTNFNPLTIWFYDQCYIRFSAADYDAKQINNKFIHLCNNSIGSYFKDFKKSHIKGNMYFMQECRQYLKEAEGYDVFEQVIKPQLREIVKSSLMCGVYGIQNRKNTHELFGYDFMVDTNYKVWLLQVNSSPSMDYSTHITTKLVKQVLQDTVKVIVDYAMAPKKEKKHVDTGKFKKIYKGVQIPDKMVNTAGLNLCLQGVALKKGLNKNNTVKITNFSLEKK